MTELATKAMCRTCRKPITYTTVELAGYRPRTGWSDGHQTFPLACFSAANLKHSPDKQTTP